MAKYRFDETFFFFSTVLLFGTAEPPSQSSVFFDLEPPTSGAPAVEYTGKLILLTSCPLVTLARDFFVPADLLLPSTFAWRLRSQAHASENQMR